MEDGKVNYSENSLELGIGLLVEITALSKIY